MSSFRVPYGEDPARTAELRELKEEFPNLNSYDQNHYLELRRLYAPISLAQLRYIVTLERQIHDKLESGETRLITYRILRFAGLIASAVTPVLALSSAPRLLTALVGAVVFLAEGAIQLTQIQERAAIDLDWSVELSRELRQFRDGMGIYGEDNRFHTLQGYIEEITGQYERAQSGAIRRSLEWKIRREGEVR